MMLRRVSFHVFACSVAASFAVGCANVHPAPVYPHEDPHFRQAQVAEPEGIEEDPARPTILAPGDIVTIRLVSQETQELVGLVVDATNKVHVPLAGDVEIGGVGITEAEARLEEAMQRFDRFVRVNVIVTDPAGQRASVIGAVQTPGNYTVRPGMRLADLVALAGGPLRQVTMEGDYVALADLGGARVYRNGEVLPINVDRALRGEPRHNVRVQAGDHVHIPPRIQNRIAIFGAVGDAGLFTFRDDLRLTEAIALAGGLTIDADDGDVRVIRGDLRNPRVYWASIEDIVDGQAHDVALQPGDIVFVTDHWIADFGEVLSRLSPILSAGVTIGVTAAVLSNP